MRRFVAAFCCLVFALPFLFAALPATDNFNRTDENPIAGNWTNRHNSIQIATNVVGGVTAAAWNTAYWNADTFSTEQYSQVVLSTFTDYIGASVRVQSGDATYYACLCDTGISTLGPLSTKCRFSDKLGFWRRVRLE